MNSNCDRLGRRKIGKNEKLWNERNHADADAEKRLCADAEKRLCAAEPAAVAVSRAPCESCRRVFHFIQSFSAPDGLIPALFSLHRFQEGACNILFCCQQLFEYIPLYSIHCNIIAKAFQEFFLVKSTYFYDTCLSPTDKIPLPPKYSNDNKKRAAFFRSPAYEKLSVIHDLRQAFLPICA